MSDTNNKMLEMYRNLRTWQKAVMGAVMLVLLYIGYFSIYIASEYEATVIDAETGKPVEGVLAVIHWETYRGSLAGGDVTGQEEIMETLSDKNGRAYFPGWGPRITSLSSSSPRLFFFKDGYELTVKLNSQGNPPSNFNFVAKSHRSQIKLQKYKGDKNAYKDKVLHLLGMYIAGATDDKDESVYRCNWTHIPMTIAIFYKARSIHSGMPLDRDSIIEEYKSRNCGSTDELMRHLQ